jgi:hypothetical protein
MQKVTWTEIQGIANPDNFEKFIDITIALPCPNEYWPQYFIAGGLIRRTISGESLEKGDIDLFFKSKADLLNFESQFKSRKTPKATLLDTKEHVITYELDIGGTKYNDIRGTKYNDIRGTKYKVQLIQMRFFPDVEQLLNSFDYNIAQCAYDPKTKDFYFGNLTLYDIGRNRMAVNKITYPLASLRRLIKYTNAGYYACNGCLQTYLEQVRAIPEQDFKDRQITYID